MAEPSRRRGLILAAVILCAFALVSGCSRSSLQRETPTLHVAAAADLAPAFEEIGKLFERETGVRVVFIFGSTGTLTQQIEHGAPMDVFAAANREYVERLERQGLILPETKALYARGRIVIWRRPESRLRLESLADLKAPEVRMVAIANPDHAPYGLAAKQALESAGLWDAIQDKIVLGEDVRQTLQFASTGNADAAIVALSLALQSKGQWTLVPENLHQPLDQVLAVLKRSSEVSSATRFAGFINSAAGRAVMRKYGFVLPGEELPG